MGSPNFAAVRAEISALFESLVGVTIQGNVAHRPLSLSGRSPVVATEDQGFRGFLPHGDVSEYDLGYAVAVYVNREAHGAGEAATVYDDVRQAVLTILTDRDASYTNFDALELPSGQWALTQLELIDGIQYLVGRIPIIALNACQE